MCPAHPCRLHHRGVVHVYAPKAAPPGARSWPRPSEPDRAVAALALRGRDADPTDGWVGSMVTLPEDTLPLTRADLGAWLWRIDLAMGLMVERARGLDQGELDWQPPDGGWSLRRVL